MTEFELIQIYFQQDQSADWLSVPIGDDGAVISAESNQQIIVTDTLVEDVHFFAGTAPNAIGHKALAVNLSDLAAMGATPKWFTLNLTLPEASESWVKTFAEGLFALAKAHNIVLIGGDTTRGPLSISITAAGTVPVGTKPLTRDAAQVGGRVGLIGSLGLAAQAVSARQQGQEPTSQQAQALDFPIPQVEAGLALQGLATAACDVSDGLLADLGHIAKASKVVIELDGDRLARICPAQTQASAEATLSGGDDYALVFVMPLGQAVPNWATDIGQVKAGMSKTGLAKQPVAVLGGPEWLQQAAKNVQLAPGHQHF